MYLISQILRSLNSTMIYAATHIQAFSLKKHVLMLAGATSVFASVTLPQLSSVIPFEIQKKNLPLSVVVSNEKKPILIANNAELSAPEKHAAPSEPVKAAEPVKAPEPVAPAPAPKKVQPTPKPAPVPAAPRNQLPQIANGKTFYVTVTAYNSEAAQTDSTPDITASGSRTRDGVIALNGVKFGTKVKLPQYFGDKIFTVEDRTSSRYGKLARADIWMLRKSDALKWGIKRNVQLVIVN